MTCPYCGKRDRQPDSDACRPCGQTVASQPKPRLAPTGRSHSTLTRQRQHPPERFKWRGKWRRW